MGSKGVLMTAYPMDERDVYKGIHVLKDDYEYQYTREALLWLQDLLLGL